MTLTLLQKIRSMHLQFDKKMLKSLGDVYSDDIQFRDPLYAVNGLEHLKDYYTALMAGLIECRFEYHHSMEMADRGEAILFWTMHYRHKKLAGGKLLELTGNTHLLFNEKIYYQRDYFDAGSMLYEHFPLTGFAIRRIKKRLGAQ